MWIVFISCFILNQVGAEKDEKVENKDASEKENSMASKNDTKDEKLPDTITIVRILVKFIMAHNFYIFLSIYLFTILLGNNIFIGR